MMRSRARFQVALMTLVLLAAGCQFVRKERPTSSATILPVSAIVVHRQSSFLYPVTYYGRVEPARQTSLSFELAGRLEAVLVDEGESVEAGQVVAKLDTSLLEAEKNVLLAEKSSESALLDRLRRGEREEVIAAARAEAMRLKVELSLAAADKERAEKVYEGRSISKSDYDKAIYAHKAAEFALERALKRLEELETGSRTEDIEAQANRVAMIDAKVDLLNVRFAKSSLVAPFDGICVQRLQDEGVTLSAGQAVLAINEANRLEARFSIPKQNLELACNANHLKINGDRYAIGQAREISQIDDTTRTVDIVIPLGVAADARVLPGQTCTLEIEKRVQADCVELPVSALVASVRGLWSCYTLRPDPSEPGNYTVEKHDVSIIHTDGVRVFVASTIPDGSMIIREGIHKVVPGMRVRVVDDGP